MSIKIRIRKSISGGLLAGGLILIGIGPSSAGGQQLDSRWLPWLGCWEASEAGADTPMLCVSPVEGQTGVELSTWSGGELISSETIQADGVMRDVDREGCQGYQEATFSNEGKRVYLKSQYVCEGGVERGGTGLLAFANPVEWLDIKVVKVAGNEVPMVLRYRPARGSRVEEAGMTWLLADRAMSVKSARIAASAPLTAGDLLEAQGKVDSKALEALVAERGSDFDVNADLLIQLADAGVSESLIDLMVAVSHPERFTVTAGMPEVSRTERARGDMPYSYGYRSRWSFWDPFFYYDPWYYGYGSYGLGYRYGYSPFMGGYGWYSGYYQPTTVIVDNNSGNYQPRPHGRFISGRGYSRGGSSGGSVSSGTRSRSPAPSTRSAPSTRRGSGSISSSGARSGSTSKSTGRTAKRRGGGGGL